MMGNINNNVVMASGASAFKPTTSKLVRIESKEKALIPSGTGSSTRMEADFSLRCDFTHRGKSSLSCTHRAKQAL